MHDADNVHGGDLKTDTVTIIGATLDLQEKVVRQVKQILLPTLAKRFTPKPKHRP